MKFAVIANPKKYEVKQVFNSALHWAASKNVTLFVCEEVCSFIGAKTSDSLVFTSTDEEAIEQADIILVMGGDGTMLYTARISRKSGKPVLGINSGRLGFMTNTQNEDLIPALDSVLAGEYTLDERHFLKAVDQNGGEYFALNEFLFTRSDTTSMINISAEYSDMHINRYWSDGLIVATPTGSTAYNLSTGGPIVEPGSGVIVITPINPHSLTTRPLVVRANKPLRIIVEPQQSGILFSYDGVVKEIDHLPLEVEITKTELAFKLIQLQGQDFFDTLRKKLMWGQDSRRIKN
ncbi:MAG: NAD(+)/NADH kinase [Balneolales bacterium]|nr:NAD(+)/NADH kinase [Balneolales bacterium]